MASRHSTPGQVSFDRAVYVLTTCVWFGHLLINSVLVELAAATPSAHGVHAARILSTLVAVALCLALHRFLRTRRRANTRFTLLVLGLSVPLAFCTSIIGVQIFEVLALPVSGRSIALSARVATYFGYQWMFFAWAALYAAGSYVLEIQDRERDLAAAEHAAHSAQLMALRLQINPHFLFNTLNTIAGLISLNRNAQAQQMLVHLSRFLRHTLAASPGQFTSMSGELDVIEQYLSIEKVRFSDRLSVSYAVEDETANAVVPGLMMLPIVENAIKHGLGKSESEVALEIGARRDGETLALWVNNTVADSVCKQDGFGIGLENVRMRLKALFGDDARIAAGPSREGWRTEILMPWSTGAA